MSEKVWEQVGKDISGINIKDDSGFSVSLSDDGLRVAIGAPATDGGSSHGVVKVYYYNRYNDSWDRIGRDISGISSGDQMGWCVSLSSDGSYLAVASPNEDTGSQTTIVETDTFTDFFGYTVTTSELIDEKSGIVRVYRYDNSDRSWNELDDAIDFELNNTSTSNVMTDIFGNIDTTTTISGNGLMIGYNISLVNTTNATDSSLNGLILSISSTGNDNIFPSINGAVKTFYYDIESSDPSWVQLGDTIMDKDTDLFTLNSKSLSTSNDGLTLAIGANSNDDKGNDSGLVQIYKYDIVDGSVHGSVDGSWNQIGQDINGRQAGERNGTSVSLNGDGTVLAVGADKNDDNGTESGVVRVYEYDPSVDVSWNQIGQDISGEAKFDKSGYSVSLNDDGTIVAIGAIGNDDNGDETGHVRVYEYDPSDNIWEQLGDDIDGTISNGIFGHSVSVSEDGLTVAVGGPGNDDADTSGVVRVFTYKIPGTACFTGEALVRTDQGEIPIKTVTTKHTINGKKIQGISKVMYTQEKVIHVEKNALGKNKPSQDTTVAPYHKFMIDGTLKMICEIVNNDTIYYKKYDSEPLYNIILETHDIMEVNNVMVDTMNPKLLLSQLFNGSLTERQRRKIINSIRKYHKRLKKNNITEAKYYRV